MKNFLFAVLKTLLWLVLIALATGLVYLLVTFKGWPLWTGAVILLGPLSLVLGIVAIRRHLFRRREKRYVKRIIDQETDKLALADASRRQKSVGDLRDRFAKASRILDRLRPGRLGSPEYVLPWFLMLGATGSGKTSALRSARVNAVATDLTPAGEPGPTGLLDWWFLDRAVILDPAGRLAGDIGASTGEWEEFLTLLAAKRRREPLSGLVAALSADELMTADEDALTNLARGMRRRLDEIMRTLGARIPVYLLITKADTIPGMTGFCSMLTKQEQCSPMGILRQRQDEPAAAWVTAALSRLAEQLKNLRLRLGGREGPVEPGLAAFPDTLRQLAPGLELLVRELFQPNPFLETPYLRGLYLASARQSGDNLTMAKGALSAFAAASPDTPPAATGLFLHDLFTSVLPDDRGRPIPLRSYLTWRTVTRLAALGASLALLACFVGLTWFSYIRNDATLDAFIEDFQEIPKLGHSFGDNIRLMTKFREELLFMEGQNRDWNWPRMGFDQTITAERKLKGAYCDIFAKGVLPQFDAVLKGEIAHLPSGKNSTETASLASYLASRLNLIDSALQGTLDAEVTQAVVQHMQSLNFSGRPIDKLFTRDFMDLYLSRLAWTDEKSGLVAERDHLTAMLRDVIRAGHIELSWLIEWTNNLPELDPFFFEQFWDPTAMAHIHGIMVQPAFTLAGRDKIMTFLDRLKTALGDSSGGQGWAEVFLGWYESEYLAAWERFAQSFPEALAWDRDPLEWKALAVRMADPGNPYFQLLDTLGRQTAPFSNSPHAPSWVRGAASWEKLRRNILEPDIAQIEMGVQENISSVSSFFQGVTRFLREETAPQSEVRGAAKPKPEAPIPPQAETLAPPPAARHSSMGINVPALKGMKTYQTYLASLGGLLETSQSSTATLALVASAYTPPAPVGPSLPGQASGAGTPLDTARNAAAELDKDINPEKAPLFTDLLTGPLGFYWASLALDAAEVIQRYWESDVVAPSINIPEKKRHSVLFGGQTGLVWKFSDGPAAPFLVKSQYGYAAKEANNFRFPFTSEFLSYLNKGSRQTQELLPQYQVSFQVLPTDVNDGVAEEPYLTTLTLDCIEKVQKIENYNYPLSMNFEWKPESCGDTTLVIHFISLSSR